MNSFDLYVAIRTQRAIRKFASTQVPPAVLHQILQSATYAPSGGNRQPWAFVVVTDPAIRDQLSNLYEQGALERRAAVSPQAPVPAPGSLRAPEAPVYIVACIDTENSPTGMVRGAHIYPAVQNLMLAARGLGLGSVITTLHKRREAQVKRLLAIPDEFETACMIPLGYPHGDVHFGGSRRRPISEVVFSDRWGTEWPT
jgi:nitroreductase